MELNQSPIGSDQLAMFRVPKMNGLELKYSNYMASIEILQLYGHAPNSFGMIVGNIIFGDLDTTLWPSTMLG
jgi:hypothetical protein